MVAVVDVGGNATNVTVVSTDEADVTCTDEGVAESNVVDKVVAKPTDAEIEVEMGLTDAVMVAGVLVEVVVLKPTTGTEV